MVIIFHITDILYFESVLKSLHYFCKIAEWCQQVSSPVAFCWITCSTCTLSWDSIKLNGFLLISEVLLPEIVGSFATPPQRSNRNYSLITHLAIFFALHWSIKLESKQQKKQQSKSNPLLPPPVYLFLNESSTLNEVEINQIKYSQKIQIVNEIAFFELDH